MQGYWPIMLRRRLFVLNCDTVMYYSQFACDAQIAKDPLTGETVPARLWTSTMRRTIETAQFIPNPIIPVRYMMLY